MFWFIIFWIYFFVALLTLTSVVCADKATETNKSKNKFLCFKGMEEFRINFI